MNVTLGRSTEGRPVEAYVRGQSADSTVLILGGFHGDEPKGVRITRRLIALLTAESMSWTNVRWVVVPVVNPDGYERRKRRNAHRVDINRNFPTRNWASSSKRSRMHGGSEPASEPETRAVIKTVKRYDPVAIVSIHSIGDQQHCNNFDGPGEALALAMRRHNMYPVTSSIGYPTPGSFGTWAGVERGIPIVTLELPSCHSPKRCWGSNRAALLACSDVCAGRRVVRSRVPGSAL